MRIETKYESPLKLKEINIVESNLKKEENISGKLSLNLSIDRKVLKIGENDYKLFLNVKLNDLDNKLIVKVKSISLFELEIDNIELVEKNGVAIIFPYLRSYLTLLTTQPGMPPIVLPAINVIKLINDKK